MSVLNTIYIRRLLGDWYKIYLCFIVCCVWHSFQTMELPTSLYPGL